MSKKFVLITGASSGIGASFAKAYAQNGYSLILVARSNETLNILAEDLKMRFLIDSHIISLDLSIENAAEKLFDACEKLNVEIEVLINNAGFGYTGTFDTQDMGRLQNMIMLNILTLTKLSHLFIPQLQKNKGTIINVSLAAFQPLPCWAVYAASKAYVLHFSEALHAELKPTGITVFSLCPGTTSTQFLKVASSNSVERNISAIQTPDEVVQEALEAIERKKIICVPGWKNKLTALLNRFLPRSIVLKLMNNIMMNRYKSPSSEIQQAS